MIHLWTAPPVVQRNHAALARALAWLLAQRPQAGSRVLLVSPSRHDVLFMQRQWPSAHLTVITIRDWNLDQPPDPAPGPFDCAIACNVMHYASQPQRWVDHLLMVSPVLVIQDLVERRRAPQPPHLAADGDCMRYCDSSRAIRSGFAGAFDLARLLPPPAYVEAFEGAGNDYHAGLAAPQHFCAVVLASAWSARPGSGSAWLRWRYRVRLWCMAHWPLYLGYKAIERLRQGLSRRPGA